MPAELQQVIAQLLAKDAEERIPTAAARRGDWRRSSARCRRPRRRAGRRCGRRLSARPGRAAAGRFADAGDGKFFARAGRRGARGRGTAREPRRRRPCCCRQLCRRGRRTRAPPAGRLRTSARRNSTTRSRPMRSRLSFRFRPWPAAGLVAVAAAIIYLLQPPSADALYKRIKCRQAATIPSRCGRREKTSRHFWRFADDPHAARSAATRRKSNWTRAAEVRLADQGLGGRGVAAAGRAGVPRRPELRAARPGTRHDEASGPDRPLRRSPGSLRSRRSMPGAARRQLARLEGQFNARRPTG